MSWAGPGARRAGFQRASKAQVSITLSGLSEIEAMPSSASQRAKAGWSLGPWPPIPTDFPAALQAPMARLGLVRRACLVAPTDIAPAFIVGFKFPVLRVYWTLIAQKATTCDFAVTTLCKPSRTERRFSTDKIPTHVFQ